MSTARYFAKANTVRAAWIKRFSAQPYRQAIFMCMAIAEHETRMGDAWPGENNWGACQLRSPNLDERARIKAGDLHEGSRSPGGALHGDSSPVSGKYAVWFATFDTELEGTDYFLGVLLSKRPKVLACIADSDPWEVAHQMYLSHYFEGVHDPRPKDSDVPGTLTDGQRANIDDYAGAIGILFAQIQTSLEDWGVTLSDKLSHADEAEARKLTEAAHAAATMLPPPDDEPEAA